MNFEDDAKNKQKLNLLIIKKRQSCLVRSLHSNKSTPHKRKLNLNDKIKCFKDDIEASITQFYSLYLLSSKKNKTKYNFQISIQITRERKRERNQK